MNLLHPLRRARPQLRALLPAKPPPLQLLLLPPLLLLPLLPPLLLLWPPLLLRSPLRPEPADMQVYRTAQAIKGDRGGADGRKVTWLGHGATGTARFCLKCHQEITARSEIAS